ncbi:MAG: TonB-dependent receptor [Gemmatimonadaceae bacterium]|nr:TonB-dependent receptor [Gemmatimonadaceae bacterium]
MHGSLAGVVRDAAGAPVRDAEIRVTDRVSGAVRSLITARDGEFRFGLLGPGVYEVAVEALGYRPVLYLGVAVAAGDAGSLRVALRRETPPVSSVDTVRAAGARIAPLAWLQERGYGELAIGRRIATDALALSPVADERGVEGLPWRFADVMVDGARLGSVSAPSARGVETFALAVPSRAVSNVGVGGLGYDVEMGGTGVGLNALSLRGGSTPSQRSAVFGGSSDVGAAAVFGGPIQRDTAHAFLGVDYQRSEVARPAWFLADDTEGLALINIARDSFATNLDAYRNETPRIEERISAFGRLDWQLGDRYAVTMRAGGTRLTASQPALLEGASAGLGTRHEALAAQASVDVVTRLTRRLTSEIRVSGEMGDVSSEGPMLASTGFAGRGVTLGASTAEPFSDQRATPRLGAMLHWDLGAHRLKLGAALAGHRFESQGTIGSGSDYRFGDAADFELGAGAWRGMAATGGTGSYRMSERAIFIQDAWAVTPGFDLTLGLRFDANRVTLSDLEPNGAWLLRSGLDNTAVQETSSRVAPRIGFRWELGAARNWLLEGGAGVYNDLPDRRDVGEALMLDRGVDVRSAIGTFANWPAVPDSVTAPSRGQALSVLGPGYEGPRTRRMSFAVQRALGNWTSYVQGVYRQTDFLARRRDLNLSSSPVGVDQYGRPLYGTLQQVGSLVAALPASNRRFSDFDAVHAIEVTGFSEYRGATIGIERVTATGFSVGVHYTYSLTEDNLAGGDAPLSPFTGGLASEGIADLDVPHRLLAAAEWSVAPSGAVRFGVIYRLRSGTPFTPGFRDGVDVDGDGVAGNDVAFVDPAVPGMDALLVSHSCLQRSSGTFALRNDCRGEMVHRLDLRASFRLRTFSSGPLDLVLDAMNVIPGTEGRIDRALYLVDRTGVLTTNPGTGVTSVPLVVNPNFGELLSDRAPGMLFRVGLRIGR